MRLLLVRLSDGMVAEVLSGLRSQVDFAITVQQVASTEHPAHARPDLQIRDWPSEPDPQLTYDLFRRLILGFAVTHALVCQPLLWYSDQVERACRDSGVRLTWCVTAPDGKIGFDSCGSQYTERNDLGYDALFPPGDVSAFATKHPQPPKGSLGHDPEALVVWGQVPWDMSHVSHHGVPYEKWINAALRQPGRVVYKRHPCITADGDVADVPPAVEVTDAHIDDLLALTPWHAAFSSTVIIEGQARGGCFFATGGRHFTDDPRWVLRTTAEALVPALRAHTEARTAQDEILLRRRISFVQSEWLLPGADSRVLLRLRTDAKTYFERRACARSV